MPGPRRFDQHVPPLGNVLVSNLRGPGKPRYLAGARLRAVYPVSTIAPGLAINITCYSYDGNLHIGIVTGASEIPDVDHLIGYLEAALPALEESMALAKPAKASPPTKKKRTTKKRKTKKKATSRARKKRTASATLRAVKNGEGKD